MAPLRSACEASMCCLHREMREEHLVAACPEYALFRLKREPGQEAAAAVYELNTSGHTVSMLPGGSDRGS
jgi:hypothetical protein